MLGTTSWRLRADPVRRVAWIRRTCAAPRAIFAIALCGLAGLSAAAGPAPIEPAAQTLLGAADHRRLPVRIVGGYPFLAGRVAGCEGGFMLDTGAMVPIILNNGFVPLALEHYKGEGTAGGAQGSASRPQVVYRHPDVGPVTLAGREFTGLGTLLSSDFGYVADLDNGGVRRDFLGFAGLPLLVDAEWVLDYRAGTLDLYRLRPDGAPIETHVRPAEVVATLSFRYLDPAKRRFLPIVTLRVDDVEIEGLFDTGVLGELTLTPAARSRLERSGRIRKTGDRYALDGLSADGAALTLDTPALTTGERNTMRLGHNLLRHYRSVWNFRRQTITLLRN